MSRNGGPKYAARRRTRVENPRLGGADAKHPSGAGERDGRSEVAPIPLRPVTEYTSEAEFVAEAVRAAVAYGHDPVTVAAIAQGIADSEAGRDQDFNEYIAERQAERQARRTGNRAA